MAEGIAYSTYIERNCDGPSAFEVINCYGDTYSEDIFLKTF